MAHPLLSAVLIFAFALTSVATAEDSGGQAPPLDFQAGPGTFPIGDRLAEIDLTEGYVFLDREETEKLLALTGNPLSGGEMAAVLPAAEGEGWFLIFEWGDIGYVADDESELDPEALIEGIREGTKAANEERQKNGWSTMQILGWHDEPRYDEATHNLTWAIIGESDGAKNINRIVKVLGRRGVMTVTLVSSPDELGTADLQLASLLPNYRFQAGSTYAEYLPGTDKLADIGLATLVAGGAGAVLVKSGLLARFWKFIVIGGLAAVAGIRKMFSGDRAEDQPISRT